MSWLSKFYHGGIHPQEEDQPIIKELIPKQRAYRQYRDQALLGMDERVRNDVQTLLEERNALSALEAEDAYIRGMRMGARMAVELLTKEK